MKLLSVLCPLTLPSVISIHYFSFLFFFPIGLPWWFSDQESASQAGDMGSVLVSARPLEEEMATHFSILAWKIPWTEEPGGLYVVYGVAKEWNTT